MRFFIEIPCKLHRSQHRRYVVNAAQNQNEFSEWQQTLAEKLEHRKEYLTEKWKRTNLAHGIEVSQDALKEGWKSTEIGRTVEKEREVLLDKWRKADKKELKKWQKNVKAGLVWTNIFGTSYTTVKLN